MERRILDEQHDPTLGRTESLPEIELDCARDALLRRYVLDASHLLETADHVVVGQHSALVLPTTAVGHQAALVQGYHHVGAVAVDLCAEGTGEGDLEGGW